MVIQEANSGVVQKVQPNDKSGKLLPNNHTKGRKRASGYLSGPVACYKAASIDQITLLSASAHSAMATDKTIS